MSFQDNLNRVLQVINKSRKIHIDELRADPSLNEIDLNACLTKLVRDNYIQGTYPPKEPQNKTYTIKENGRLFAEAGGYGAITIYEQETLDIAKTSRNIAIIAMCIAGFALIATIVFGVLTINK